MSGPGKITPRQSAALTYLLEGKTVQDAARLAQVSERQLYRWLSDPPFKSELRQAQGRQLDQVGARLLKVAGDAVEVLYVLAMDPPIRDDAPGARVQLRAAQTLIESSLKWRELTDLEERIAALENKLP